MHILAGGMAKMAGGMLLVRTFVLGETHVAIDAEHRAAVRPWIGGEVLRNFREPWRHRGDEVRHWRLHTILEALLVRLEPGPLIVRLQLAEEGEEVLGETVKTIAHALHLADGANSNRVGARRTS